MVPNKPKPYPETLISKAAVFSIGGAIDGDYYEFGVFNGTSLIAAYHAFSFAYNNVLERCGHVMTPQSRKWMLDRWDRMKFWGFDSFDGLPEVKGVDIGGAFKGGDFRCGYDQVVKNLKAADLDMSRINLRKGWFSETLTPEFVAGLNGRKAAVIHIDCDLYESTRDVFQNIGPLIDDGTIIIFDDWFQFRGNPERGEQLAFREFLEANPHLRATEYNKEGVWRNSFILNKVAR